MAEDEEKTIYTVSADMKGYPNYRPEPMPDNLFALVIATPIVVLAAVWIAAYFLVWNE